MEIIFQHGLYFISPAFYSSSRFFYHLYFNSFIISLYRFHGENDNNDDDDDDDDDTLSICVTFFFFFLFEKFDNLHVVRYCYIINKKKVVA